MGAEPKRVRLPERTEAARGASTRTPAYLSVVVFWRREEVVGRWGHLQGCRRSFNAVFDLSPANSNAVVAIIRE